MKYSILGFNQKAVLATTKIVHKTINGKDKLVPLKLDVTDLLILQHLADFPNRKKIIKTIIDDKMFFWVDYKTLIEELPILDIKKQALSDRLSKLVELGIIEKSIISHNGYGNSTFFRMGEKYESLLYSKEKDAEEDTLSECTPMVSDYERVSYSTTKGYCSQLQDNNNIINNNTTNNKEEIDNSISKKDEESEFIDRMYASYPAKCPKRGTTTGKSHKDKQRIKKLLKTYTMEEIEKVFQHEIEEKYDKQYMQNFSTFLNNFPDPNALEQVSLFVEEKQSESNSDSLIINGQIYR